ncbi:MAG TPA: hypothetical protein VFL62_12380 [Bradyrhizobium sp.]|uniref:hypothetical protein n=1 Tax=Bradyrhizobium sp. TaxID=376 RepID=UPI002D7E31C9|nr:hypothetical protein [Bradyrhizobium sp.]HET7887016.1 hypothetical protein [Bradyrhizobium sp.]
MDDFIARANIDHFLELLAKDDIAPHTRSTITKLLIEEEDKLGLALAQLEFAEERVAACRDHMSRLARLCERFEIGSAARAQADKLLIEFGATLGLVESVCARRRKNLQARAL